MKIRTSLPIILSVVAMSTSTTRGGECFVDFETLPSGAMSVDNLELIGSYTCPGGSTTVTFGFDTDNNGVIDVNARLETRTSNDQAPQAYTAGVNNRGSNPDQDLTCCGSAPTCILKVTTAAAACSASGAGAGGSFLLREPKNPESPTARLDAGDAFLIVYGGTLPTSASGQIWDIDADGRDPDQRVEKFTVDALAANGTVIETRELVGLTIGDPASRNGLPSTFEFQNLSPDIAKIRITLDVEPSGGAGLAFDNFNATGVGRPPPIPTVSAWGLIVLALMLAAGITLYFGRRHPEPTE